MEVVVQAQGATPAPDTFVSLRVGQVQRHARFAPCRTYRFDQVDPTSKNAMKLELFKRIGYTTVTFGGQSGEIQDVEVHCTEGAPIELRVSTDQRRTSTPPVEAKKTHRQVNSARGYLAQHGLEELLRDAMKDVMKAKPPNPHEFLAAYILRCGNEKRGNLPKIYQGPDKLAPDAPLVAQKPSNLQRFAETDFSMPMTSKALAPEKAPRTLPPLEQKPVQLEVSNAAPKSLPPMQRCASQPDNFAPQAQPILPKSQTLPLSQMSLNRQAQQFENAPLVPKVAETAAVQPYIPFNKKASVGTWICTPTTRTVQAMTEKYPHGFPQFQMRPSVGTWLAVRLPPEPEQVPVYRNFKLRPSVGTWCAALPCEQPTDETSYRKFNLRPSVGTWCVAKQTPSLAELTHWEPAPAETHAMGVILAGRLAEIQDLTQKHREVTASLEAALRTGSAEVEDLETAQATLEGCIGAAQAEYDALEQWSSRRGLSQSQPSSPVLQTRDI